MYCPLASLEVSDFRLEKVASDKAGTNLMKGCKGFKLTLIQFLEELAHVSRFRSVYQHNHFPLTSGVDKSRIP